MTVYAKKRYGSRGQKPLCLPGWGDRHEGKAEVCTYAGEGGFSSLILGQRTGRAIILSPAAPVCLSASPLGGTTKGRTSPAAKPPPSPSVGAPPPTVGILRGAEQLRVCPVPRCQASPGQGSRGCLSAPLAPLPAPVPRL